LFCDNFAKYDETNKTYVFVLQMYFSVLKTNVFDLKMDIFDLKTDISDIPEFQKWPNYNTQNRYKIMA